MRPRLARVLLVGCCMASPARAQDVSLVPGPGRDAVAAACATCHTLVYIPMNSHFMAPEAWQAEVNKMRTAFGAPISDAAANAIVAYLVSNYGARPK